VYAVKVNNIQLATFNVGVGGGNLKQVFGNFLMLREISLSSNTWVAKLCSSLSAVKRRSFVGWVGWI